MVSEITDSYEEIRNRWLWLITGVYSDSGEKPQSVDEAMVVLNSYPEAKIVFEKKMVGVCQRVTEALAEAEDDLQLIERQISSLSEDDRPEIKPAIRQLEQRLLDIDMLTVGGCADGPKGGIQSVPDKRLAYKPIGEDELGLY